MTEKIPFTEKTISVTELNRSIRACLDSPLFHYVEVFGEVSGARMSGAHLYFTLKDKESEIPCTSFNATRTYVPKDGESVIVRGEVDYWIKRGKLALQARAIAPAGQGLLALEFEKLRARLQAEGLFDEAHKIPVPKYAKNVLVVTSKTGAVIRDIVTTVRKKNPVVNITVRDVRVQGDGAAHEIAGVLARVDNLGYDVIIIARGGGSLEDLAPFYDEELVRAVYAMQTPVVSAVGHETDFSLVDFVADARAATPTAAGELVAYDYYALCEKVADCTRGMKRGVKRVFERRVARTGMACAALERRITGFSNEREKRVRNLVARARLATEKRVASAESAVERLAGKLDALSPLKVLARGYFNVQAAGSTVTSVRSLKRGDTVTARGKDGSFEATVTEVYPSENNQ